VPKTSKEIILKKTALVLASAILVSACGGGGESGGFVAGPAAPVTAANQTAVAQDAVGTSFQLFDSAAESPLAGAVVTPDEGALMRLARAEMAKLPTYLAQAPKAIAGAVATVSLNCANGGTLVVTANDPDDSGNNVTAGDSVSIAFNSCVTGSQTANGTLAFGVDSLTGVFGSYPYSGQMTVTFGNLTLSGPNYSLQANGSMSLTTNVNGVNDMNESISAPSLTMTATYAGVFRSRSLNGYVLTHRRVPDATYTYLDSYEGGGTVTGANTLASVTVSFSTPYADRFIRRSGDLYPYTGQMTLTGMNGSKLRITAEDNDSVLLEVDATGDGTYESSTPNVPWSAIVN
jgi:hypothetical protein